MRAAGLTVRTPAKVNLGLRILGRRRDGYHRIRTVLAAVDLWDTLRFEPGGRELRLECDAADLPVDETNLVLRAAAALEGRVGHRLPGARIRLEKRIPVGRGLGGGSSDAAATLLALNRLFDLGLSRPELDRLAAGIGMDVPFFLYGGRAAAVGRGEQVFPLTGVPELALLLLVPDFGISTVEAYRRLPPLRAPGGSPPDRVPVGTIGVSVEPEPGARKECGRGFEAALRNDLESSGALRTPRCDRRIPEMRRALMTVGAKGAAMSGSGSAVYGVFADRAAAVRAAASCARKGITAIATRTISRAEHREALRDAGISSGVS